MMYYDGQGVKQDYQQAAKWYKEAAEQDNVMAQGTLGMMYVIGQGVTQNYSKAKMWVGKACDNGDQRACEAYGQIFKE